MTRIKICGIKEVDHALAAAGAGADFIGLVFTDSRRRVSPRQAKKITAALKQSKASTQTVGVFVNTPSAMVKRIARECELDWIQLSGDEPWAYCRELSLPIIKVVRVSHMQSVASIISDLEYGARILGNQKHLFLLDSSDPEKYGGTGKKFDWDLARPVAGKFPIIIAGGLNPANVNGAIETIRPWGVDVSTGVETGGVKDVKKMIEFIEAVRQADAG